jgi:hypothetical protein
MKEDNQRAAALAEAWARRFKRMITLAVILAICGTRAHGQCFNNTAVFINDMKLTYDIYFKWGLVMPKAGTASLLVKETEYQGIPAWNTCILANTVGMINKVFSVRDTVQNYMAKENPRLLYSGKRTCEGGYYEMDDLTYSYRDNKTYIHATRRSLNRLKADTALTGRQCVLDLAGSLLYAGVFSQENLNEQGHTPAIQVSMGSDLINLSYRYAEQQIVEHGAAKFRTRLFIIDIYDEAFTESREAVKMWIGDDPNHIPIKIRAKLKIGAMEIYYKSAQNLRYPLTCRTEMPQ